MIFIVADFTTATRAEPGNIFFEWSRSVENPNQFVLVEAFRDREAGEAHVSSDHFKAAMARLPDAISDTPEIVSVEAPGDGWGPMAEPTRPVLLDPCDQCPAKRAASSEPPVASPAL